MQTSIISQIEELEGLTSNAAALMEVVRDSCRDNDYTSQELSLEYAIEQQWKVINKLSSISCILMAQDHIRPRSTDGIL